MRIDFHLSFIILFTATWLYPEPGPTDVPSYSKPNSQGSPPVESGGPPLLSAHLQHFSVL